MVTAAQRTCPECQLLIFRDDLCPRCRGPRPGSGAAGRLTLDPEQRYEVAEALGSGGMGIVYRVLDLELDEQVALKVLDPHQAADEEAVAQFKSEIRIARRVHHPAVARLHDFFTWYGKFAISMEYIAGQSLERRLEGGALPPAEVRRYMRYICSGLQAAHRIGVIHRDLKPANILIDPKGRAHIVDFGIAVLGDAVRTEVETETVFGTPCYMSPEQAYYPERVDARSDVYSLGVVLYRLLSGAVPFSDESTAELFRAHLERTPPPPRCASPEISATLQAIVLRCLEKDPDRRYQSAREVWEALERAIPAGPQASEETEEGGRPEATVLVVDDEALSRRLLGDALRKHHLRVLEAEDGFRGVQQAMSEKPDLIILDLIMPVLDGREALRILKSTSATRDIPVVMLTSLSDDEEAVLAREVGAAAWLTKPVETDVIELLVERFT